MTTTTASLSEPVLTDGLATPRYFNGRLLSGESLTQDRDAARALRERLGRAVGDGVLEGLTVHPGTGARLLVKAGLALNRDGATLRLPLDLEVSFEARGADGVLRATGAFADCAPIVPAGRQAVPGVYVLVMGPATGTRGRAPVSSLGGGDVCCNVRDDVEGVQFRLASVLGPATEIIADATVRGRVAALCFGAQASALGAPGLTPLPQCFAAEQQLSRAEVPLAAFRWTGNGFGFVDAWAVRRIVAPAPPEGDTWSDLVGAKGRALREAMMLQLRDHLRDVPSLAAANLAWLPPAGVLPDAREAAWRTFLGGMAPSSATQVASVQDLRAIVRQGLERDPFAVSSTALVPVDVYTAEQQAVFVRSTRARIRVLAPLQTNWELYAAARDPGNHQRATSERRWIAIERVDSDHKVYAFDLEPGAYALDIAQHSVNDASFPRVVTAVGGSTAVVDLTTQA